MPDSGSFQLDPGVWRALRVSEGPMGVSGVGVCQQLSTPLANAGVSVIYISTFNTDYVLVEESKLAQTVTVLRANFEVR